MHITVDATDDPDWKYNVGFVPTITEQKAPPADEDTYAIICGPPIMIKFTQPVLDNNGYGHDRIIMSLENRMKCGIGMCGRCNIGREFRLQGRPGFHPVAVKRDTQRVLAPRWSGPRDLWPVVPTRICSLSY
jgi:sulfhydrogenase subunit gamma (sulfur reductase)